MNLSALFPGVSKLRKDIYAKAKIVPPKRMFKEALDTSKDHVSLYYGPLDLKMMEEAKGKGKLTSTMHISCVFINLPKSTSWSLGIEQVDVNESILND